MPRRPPFALPLTLAGLLLGCAAPRPAAGGPEPAPAAAPAEVAAITWQWVEAVTPGERIAVEAPDRYTLRFDGEGSVAVRADCNRGSGAARFGEEASLRLGPIVLTKMACPPGSRSDRFARDLDRVASWSLREGDLVLALSDAGTLRFRPGS